MALDMELKLVGDETRSCVGGAPSVGAIIGGGRVQHLPKFGGLVLDCIEADFCDIFRLYKICALLHC